MGCAEISVCWCWSLSQALDFVLFQVAIVNLVAMGTEASMACMAALVCHDRRQIPCNQACIDVACFNYSQSVNILPNIIYLCCLLVVNRWKPCSLWYWIGWTKLVWDVLEASEVVLCVQSGLFYIHLLKLSLCLDQDHRTKQLLSFRGFQAWSKLFIFILHSL